VKVISFLNRSCQVLVLALGVVIVFASAAANPSQSNPQNQSQSLQVSSGSRIEPLRPGFRFPYGETLNYSGDWRFFTAGVATLKIDPSGGQNHVSATADSTGVVTMLFRVQDRFNTYFDARSLCSIKVMKHTEEGAHQRENVVNYDYARGKAVLDERNLKDGTQKRVENDIPSCVTDFVSGIFYISSLPLQVGATYTFAINDGGKTVTAQANVEAKEQIKTPAGTFETVRVGPSGDSGALLKNKGRVWIWYSDDGRHLPIQMRAKLLWGTLTIYLTSISK
jgi:hypothetical protein